jgi:hypothetical protein
MAMTVTNKYVFSVQDSSPLVRMNLAFSGFCS